MNKETYFIFSLSIAVAAIIGLVRFNKIETAYRPFLFYVLVSFANEIISYLLPEQPKKYLLIDLNLFTLFEYCILLTQFYYWKIFFRLEWLLYLLLGGYFVLWVLENFFISHITVYNFIQILVHSFIMVLLSINVINRLAVHESGPLYRNAKFIICIGLIIFFIYNIIVNTLFLNAESKPLALKIFNIRVYVNSLTNVLFAFGVYFIPEKQNRRELFK
jgi:hypothetical protein